MDKNLLQLGSAALKKAALNEEAKAFVLNHPALYQTLKKAANRYIGGESLQEAVATIKGLNDRGYIVTTDFMGESIRNEKDANEATDEFVKLANTFAEHKINSSVSLDLSHIGMLVSKDLARQNLDRICMAAASAIQEVIISMEGTDRTDMILQIYQEALREHANLGITLQAYLHRTREDLQEMMRLPGSVRLVKGAYDVPNHLALPRGEELNKIYLEYTEQLISANHPCAIASHDEKIHGEAIRMIDRYRPGNYVLERLLGICNDSFSEYVQKGYNCRIYVVYGREWFLYLCNRWAEYPLDLFRGLADIVGE